MGGTVNFLIINNITWISVLIFSLAIPGCGGGDGGSDTQISQGTPIQNATVRSCFIEDYSDPATSEYILPYQVGMTFLVSQGNCGRFSTHRPVCRVRGGICGDLRYAYDFQMPVGIVLLASRSGEVVTVTDNFPTNGLISNIIVIKHSDDTLGRYLHLAENSSMVAVGDLIPQGDPIAMSGDSGPTGNMPHLHFDVLESENNTCSIDASIESGCVSIPITFRNAQPLDAPLIEDTVYEALPF